MLTGKFVRSYPKNGSTVFVYEITGTEEEWKKVEEIKGDGHRLDDKTGKPLHFTAFFAGDKVEFAITENDKFVVDNSKFERMKSLVDQYGIDVAKLMLNME
jgi:hypothetical protein